MLIQDLNYIETVAENVEGGASVNVGLSAGGKVTYGNAVGFASDYELDVKQGFFKFSLSEDIEQASGGFDVFTLGKGGGFSGSLSVNANA